MKSCQLHCLRSQTSQGPLAAACVTGIQSTGTRIDARQCIAVLRPKFAVVRPQRAYVQPFSTDQREILLEYSSRQDILHEIGPIQAECGINILNPDKQRKHLPVKTIRPEYTLLNCDHVITGSINHGKTEAFHLVCDVFLPPSICIIGIIPIGTLKPTHRISRIIASWPYSLTAL
jgi:hypothetical protein